MTRRPTLSGLLWPDDSQDSDLPQEWARNVAVRVLDWTWRAFDNLASNHLSRIDLAQPLEQLERDLTRNHFMEIQEIWKVETDGFSSLVPFHEWPEMETRSSASARPPAYDLGFTCNQNRRWAWPIEAKVLPTAGTFYEYMRDVEKFTTGIAAPLVGEGGMIGYLQSGMPNDFFTNLQHHLSEPLSAFTGFTARPHRASSHKRSTAPTLRLHHMVMILPAIPSTVPGE